MLAARNGYLEIVSYLLKKGANLDVVNSRGETALHLALSGSRGDEKVFEILLRHPQAPVLAKVFFFECFGFLLVSYP